MSLADDLMDAEQAFKLPATLEEIATEKVKRDWRGRPLILQPDGRRIAYSRASSFGDNIDDKYNVQKWETRQVARGMAMAPHLLSIVPKRLLTDPWLDQAPEEKKVLNRVVDQAKEAAGSNLKSTLGTQIHAATEYIDRGDHLEDSLRDVPKERRDLLIERANAYYKVVQEYRFRYSAIEKFGVQDEVQVAGTTDRLGFVPFWPEHQSTVIDVKTSSSLDFAGITFAVQLATYANMVAYDLETEERSEFAPDLNKKWALIIHIARERGGHVTLARVNIEQGWRQAHLANDIIKARAVGKEWVREMDEGEMSILGATSRAELMDIMGTGNGWTRMHKDLANERWAALR